MKAQNIIATLQNKKGQHVPVTWARQAKTRKDCPFIVGKRTTAHVRAGINFANLASVKQGIESGERGEVQPLPWGEWVKFPFIIGHKGNDYVRLYPASFDNLVPVVEWTRDGVPCHKSDVAAYLLASELRDSDDQPECFTVKAESIIEIDGERF